MAKGFKTGGRPFVDLTGQHFGSLTVISRIDGTLPVKWKCRCDCGNESNVFGGALKNGRTSSCGKAPCKKHGGKGPLRHGMSHTSIHGVWCAMRARCESRSNPAYYDYGWRGIRVCERWQVFENFLADMGPRPQGATLDRINNDGNYEPGNCRWTGRREQANNRRSNRIIECFGERLTLSQWAERTGIKSSTIRERLDRCGWPIERALAPRPS